MHFMFNIYLLYKTHNYVVFDSYILMNIKPERSELNSYSNQRQPCFCSNYQLTEVPPSIDF